MTSKRKLKKKLGKKLKLPNFRPSDVDCSGLQTKLSGDVKGDLEHLWIALILAYLSYPAARGAGMADNFCNVFSIKLLSTEGLNAYSFSRKKRL